MAENKFTKMAQRQNAQPDFHACANECFKASQMGMSPVQASAMLENMKASGLESSQRNI